MYIKHQDKLSETFNANGLIENEALRVSDNTYLVEGGYSNESNTPRRVVSTGGTGAFKVIAGGRLMMASGLMGHHYQKPTRIGMNTRESSKFQ